MLSSQSAAFRCVNHSCRLLTRARPLKFNLLNIHACTSTVRTQSLRTVILSFILCEKGVNQFHEVKDHGASRRIVGFFQNELHYVPRSPATFDFTLTLSQQKISYMHTCMHAMKWIFISSRHHSSAAGLGEQLMSCRRHRTMSAVCERRIAGP